MFEKIIAQIALALFSFLEKRIKDGSTAIDAQDDRDRLLAAGSRLDAWMQQQNSAGSRGQSIQGGPTLQEQDLHAVGGTMDSKR